MSSKVTLKHRTSTASQPGFHLYEDVLDSWGATTPEDESPVYLRLEGIAVQLEAQPGEGGHVTLTLTRELARELGLVPPKP